MINNPWTLTQIRQATFTNEAEELLTYRLAGKLSPHLTWVFLRWGVAPNTITFMFIGLLILAAGILAVQSVWGGPLAAVLIFASYVVDCSDGPVARLTGKTSTIGDRLDLFGHWLTNNLLVLGATLGQASLNGSDLTWLTGMVAMMGSNIYYYLQHHLLPHPSSPSSNEEIPQTNPQTVSHDKSIIKQIRNLFHLFAPIDTNLLIITGLIGYPFLGIQVWAILANLATFAIFAQYYRRETTE